MLTLPDSLHPRTRERVTAWAADPDVVGVVWVGSRSRGLGDAGSDDDLEVLLTPEAFGRVAPVDSYVMEPDPQADPPRLVYDAQLSTLAVLVAKAGSPRDLDHWPYERSPVLVDRTGDVERAVAAAGAMAPDFRRARIQHGALERLRPQLVAEGVPERAGLAVFFSELMHPLRAAERAAHGLN